MGRRPLNPSRHARPCPAPASWRNRSLDLYRHLACPASRHCLDVAARLQWPAWGCALCPLAPTPIDPGDALLEPPGAREALASPRAASGRRSACQSCGGPIPATSHPKAAHCSPECGARLWPSHYDRCECGALKRRGRPVCAACSRIELVCAHCGAVRMVTRWQLRRWRYCSRRCAALARGEGKRPSPAPSSARGPQTAL